MDSPVTITPDPSPDQPVTITPDAAPPSLMDRALHGAKEFWNQINPVAGIQGAAQLVNHPVQTYKQDLAARQGILQKAEEAYKRGDYAAAMGHGLYAFIPFAGPNLERSAEQFQSGDIAGGIGSSVGQGVALAAPEAIKGAKVPLSATVANKAGSAAEEMYQSALKPSTTLGPGKVSRIVQSGLQNEIPVSAAGAEKLSTLVDDLNSKIKAGIDTAQNQGATVNKYAVASRLSDTAKKFSTQVTPETDLNAISEAGNEFLRNQPGEIPAAQAQALKQGTYAQLKGKAYGELKSSTIEAQKALARGIKEELASQFPELNDLNATEARLLDLQPILEKAVQRIQNHQLIGIGTPAVGMGMKAATGSNALASAGALLKLVLDNPAVKSRLGIALNHAAQAKGIPIPLMNARFQGYVNALGQGVNAAKPSEEPTQ